MIWDHTDVLFPGRVIEPLLSVHVGMLDKHLTDFVTKFALGVESFLPLDELITNCVVGVDVRVSFFFG